MPSPPTVEELEIVLRRFASGIKYFTFSNSLAVLCEAERRYIHDCSNDSADARLLSAYVANPFPVRVFRFDQDSGLELFQDRSLYFRCGKASETWRVAKDYLNRLEPEYVTAGVREFFGITVTDEEVISFAITVVDREGLEHLLRDENGNIESFLSREDAEEWLADFRAGRIKLRHESPDGCLYIITPFD